LRDVTVSRYVRFLLLLGFVAGVGSFAGFTLLVLTLSKLAI
jgi:hypothetical protein